MYFQIVASQANRTAALAHGEIELEEGWFSPLNGYQYKVSTSSHVGQQWIETRRICQSWGADLIVHGVRDARIRKYAKSLQTIPTMFGIKSLRPRMLNHRFYNKPGCMMSLSVVRSASPIQVYASLDTEVFDDYL